MARQARERAPGAIHHVVSRFVNREFRLRSASERAEYLRRVAASIAGSDWKLLGYALMSSHVHWAAVAGEDPCWRFIKPLHSGFASWFNRTKGTIGPVFASRPTVVVMDRGAAGHLLAYLHNNPVRAGVVADPVESTWTSHRAYVGLEDPPSWLDVTAGLSLSGFDAEIRGRTGFHEFVSTRTGAPRDLDLSGGNLAERRVTIRRALGAPVELANTTILGGEAAHSVVAGVGTPLRPRWPGDLAILLELVARESSLAVEVVNSGRSKAATSARRLMLAVGVRQLGLSITELAARLGISIQAGSKLLRQAPQVAPRRMVEIGETCWRISREAALVSPPG
jgi:hypothetical protein